MIKRNVYLTLDCAKSGSQFTVEGLHVGDKRSCELHILLRNGIIPLNFDDENIAVIMNAQKPDGTTISALCEISADKKEAIYTLDVQDTTVAGIVGYELIVAGYDGENYRILYSATFSTVVSAGVIVPVFKKLETQPEDWATDYKKYFRKTENGYEKISDNTCPAFNSEDFYFLINPNYDSENDYSAFEETVATVQNLTVRMTTVETGKADKTYVDNNFEKIQYISMSELNNKDSHLDPRIIYKVANHGIVIVSNDSDGLDQNEAQYYFAEDGMLRYRHRAKVNGAWPDWPSQFTKMETTVNKTATINSGSTDEQYPSAKAVYDSVEAVYDNVPLFKYAVRSGASSSDTVNLDDATDPRTIYNYNRGQGFIIPATGGAYQTQYYLADDGVLRYRTRRKVNGAWEAWNPNFDVVINEGNLVQKLENSLNPYLSPQNKADKYFVRTCIDKSKVKLNGNTQILGFGDSIMSKGYGGSWMDKVKNRIGCPEPINMAVGGAQFYNNGNNQLSAQLTSFFSKVDNEEIDAAAIDLVIIAGGTNDAYNGTPITTFNLAVHNFFSNLKTGFTNRIGSCPPVLVITPIRRGKEADINAADENNIELKIARYSAVLNNLALMNYFSVLNGFDIPVLVDDMTIKGAAAETTQISSFMYKTSDSGDAYDDILHVHPNPTSGVNTYAQAVINAIGYSETPDISGKADKSYVDSQNAAQNTVIAGKADKSEIPDISGKADKATTLAGYGITDAYTKRESINLAIGTVDDAFIDDMSIDNTVDQTYNPNGHYIMHYVDGQGERHNLFDFSNYFAGKSEIPDISGKFDKSKIVKRATDAQVGLAQDTVFSTQAADDYLSYFLRDRPTANQVDATIEEYLDALFLDTVHDDYPRLHIDNTIDQTYNPNGHYIMYYIDSALDRHNIFDFSVLPMSYTLTAQDKTDIANIVLQLLPNADVMNF